jgi:hypothetical protein
MRFFLAQCISFILGAVVAVVLIKLSTPEVPNTGERMEHKPHKSTPERMGKPPNHDKNKQPNRPQK